MVVIIKYRAILIDHYKGGSGMPFEDKAVISVEENTTIESVFCLVEGELNFIKNGGLSNKPTLENVMLISVEVVEA